MLPIVITINGFLFYASFTCYSTCSCTFTSYLSRTPHLQTQMLYHGKKKVRENLIMYVRHEVNNNTTVNYKTQSATIDLCTRTKGMQARLKRNRLNPSLINAIIMPLLFRRYPAPHHRTLPLYCIAVYSFACRTSWFTPVEIWSVSCITVSWYDRYPLPPPAR